MIAILNCQFHALLETGSNESLCNKSGYKILRDSGFKPLYCKTFGIKITDQFSKFNTGLCDGYGFFQRIRFFFTSFYETPGEAINQSIEICILEDSDLSDNQRFKVSEIKAEFSEISG